MLDVRCTGDPDAIWRIQWSNVEQYPKLEEVLKESVAKWKREAEAAGDPYNPDEEYEEVRWRKENRADRLRPHWILMLINISIFIAG